MTREPFSGPLPFFYEEVPPVSHTPTESQKSDGREPRKLFEYTVVFWFKTPYTIVIHELDGFERFADAENALLGLKNADPSIVGAIIPRPFTMPPPFDQAPPSKDD